MLDVQIFKMLDAVFTEVFHLKDENRWNGTEQGWYLINYGTKLFNYLSHCRAQNI